MLEVKTFVCVGRLLVCTHCDNLIYWYKKAAQRPYEGVNGAFRIPSPFPLHWPDKSWSSIS